MTKEIRNPNVEGFPTGRSPGSSFVIHHSFGFRHSSFVIFWCLVIRHSSLITILAALLTTAAFASADTNTEESATVLVVVGAPGEEEYGKNFAKWAGLWEEASRKGRAHYLSIGLSNTNEATDLEQLKEVLATESKELTAAMWLVLIGHGTFDGKEAKFNLRGPDLSATELSDGLKSFRRPLAVVNGASCSAPFINN